MTHGYNEDQYIYIGSCCSCPKTEKKARSRNKITKSKLFQSYQNKGV